MANSPDNAPTTSFALKLRVSAICCYSSRISYDGGSGYDYEAPSTNGESEVATNIAENVWIPFWVKPKKILQTISTDGSTEEAKILNHAPNEMKPERLLAHRHIRVLMVIVATFSVWRDCSICFVTAGFRLLAIRRLR